MKSPKPVKAWAILMDGCLDAYWIYALREEAKEAGIHRDNPRETKVIRVLVTPIHPKRKGRRK